MIHILQDREFWSRVEYRASGWLFAAPEKELRRYWIDGFEPLSCQRTNAAAEVSGVAWVMRKNGGGEFNFLATIPWQVVNRCRAEVEVERIEIDLERKTVVLALGRSPPQPHGERESVSSSRESDS